MFFFGYDKFDVTSSAQTKLNQLADILNKYPDTYVLIEGHTDDTGADDYNMNLSEKRAIAVKNHLESKGVKTERMTVKWYGETQPKYPNDSESNSQKNRRVELAIFANEEMKQQAKDGKLD